MFAVAKYREVTKNDSFTSGVLILSLSAIIVKIIGLIYKIPMLRLLGSEGMGYFNSAYEIYALFCSIATTGLPVAMSLMISAEKDADLGAKRIFLVALKLFLALGLVGGCIVFAFAKPFAAFLGSDLAAPCLLAISPCVLLICISSAYRGYFQGLGRMVPIAVSQTIEALGKLILGLIFAFVALRSGFSVYLVAAFAVAGLTLGTAVSVLYMAVTKRISQRSSLIVGRDGGVLRRLLATAVPITLSSAVVSIGKVVDMSRILRRLQDIGQEADEAFAIYGNYTTLALPLFSLAPALITSVAMPLIPSLSGAVARKDEDGQVTVVGDAMRLTAFISLPISLGLTLFSRPILELIFSGEEAAIDCAAPLLAILGLAVSASCFITVGNAILQAYGRSYVPIFSMALGIVAKIILAFILIGNRSFGILGAPISTLICDLLINAVNFYFICRRLPATPDLSRALLMPFLSSVVSVSLARLAYNFASRRLGEGALVTLGSIALAVGVYCVGCLAFGVFTKEEIFTFPIIGNVLHKEHKENT